VLILYFIQTLGDPDNKSALAFKLGDITQFRKPDEEDEVCVRGVRKQKEVIAMHPCVLWKRNGMYMYGQGRGVKALCHTL
jgi:hypothetical protein